MADPENLYTAHDQRSARRQKPAAAAADAAPTQHDLDLLRLSIEKAHGQIAALEDDRKRWVGHDGIIVNFPQISAPSLARGGKGGQGNGATILACLVVGGVPGIFRVTATQA